jgi:hypothetical protein
VTERQPGSDPIGELQRWLVRSGARSVTRQLGDQVRTALGGGTTHADVWESATADYEAPECQWCPICRARRRLRDTGPGLSSSLAAAGDAVTVVLQDAAAAFEAAVTVAARQARPRGEAPASGAVWDEATGAPASTTVWDEAAGPPSRPLPRIVPDPPAGTAGASGSAEAAGAAEREEPGDPPTGPAATDPGPGGAAGPGTA